MNRSILEQRLADLQLEYGRGKQLLTEREMQAAAIREQLLRIGGAIRVISELLAESEPEAVPAALSQEESRAAHSSLAQ